MRSREGAKRPCSFCGSPTLFELAQRGPRGAHLRWLPCCVPCGEEPARREAKNRDSRPEAPPGSPDQPAVATERTQAAQLSLEETLA